MNSNIGDEDVAAGGDGHAGRPAGELPRDRGNLATEQRNSASMRLHEMTVRECVDLMHEEDREVFRAMKRARHLVAKLIEAAEPGFLRGGRVVYVGAGTSGRLGVLDASEAPPTFCVEPGRIVGIIAGGDAALRKSSEGLEDDPRGAWPALRELGLDERDTVIAIAAGGTTPYALGALEYSRRELADGHRPVTALVTCANVAKPDAADHMIVLKTGPEVLTGSTRMKAGTATKMTLNTISTTLMVRAGRVYENLMVDVRATNDKLRDRAARIVMTLADVTRDEALALVSQAGGSAKAAIVMARLGVSGEAAAERLANAGGRLDVVLGPGASGDMSRV